MSVLPVQSDNLWLARYGRLGDWDWYYRREINGWVACVHDDSQVRAPKQPTRYHISAICSHWIRQGREHYTDLETAKREALALALRQGHCDGVNTPRHYEEGASSRWPKEVPALP